MKKNKVRTAKKVQKKLQKTTSKIVSSPKTSVKKKITVQRSVVRNKSPIKKTSQKMTVPSKKTSLPTKIVSKKIITKKSLSVLPAKGRVTNTKTSNALRGVAPYGNAASLQKKITSREAGKTKVPIQTEKKPRELQPVALPTENQYPIMNDVHELMVGTLHEPAKKSDTIVIMLHGFVGSRNLPLTKNLATALARSGIAAYRFDFSGNGDSEGKFEDSTPNKLIREAGLIVKHFRERYAKVYLYGHSLGGSVAVAIASVGAVDGLVTVAAPMHVERMDNILSPEQREQIVSCGFTMIKVRRSVGDIPLTLKIEFLEEARAIQPLSLATYIKCPALLVHGSADTLVPVEDTNSLFEAIGSADKDVLLIGGGDHTFLKPDQQDAVISGVVSWMKKRK